MYFQFCFSKTLYEGTTSNITLSLESQCRTTITFRSVNPQDENLFDACIFALLLDLGRNVWKIAYNLTCCSNFFKKPLKIREFRLIDEHQTVMVFRVIVNSFIGKNLVVATLFRRMHFQSGYFKLDCISCGSTSLTHILLGIFKLHAENSRLYTFGFVEGWPAVKILKFPSILGFSFFYVQTFWIFWSNVNEWYLIYSHYKLLSICKRFTEHFCLITKLWKSAK